MLIVTMKNKDTRFILLYLCKENRVIDASTIFPFLQYNLPSTTQCRQSEKIPFHLLFHFLFEVFPLSIPKKKIIHPKNFL